MTVARNRADDARSGRRTTISDQFYRFGASIGWAAHLWKSATRQDHAAFRPALQTLLPRDGIAIDVGAHGGQLTRLLAGLAPDGLVVAVEPSGYARSVLRPALWARGVSNVVVVATALGAAPGVALLRTPLKRRGDMGYGLASIATAAAAGRKSVAEPVVVTTLDDLVATLGLARLDFVKADVEGHEAALVTGGRATLRRYRPALQLEHDAHHLARAGSSMEALWAELRSLDYLPHVVTDGVLSRLPPDAPQTGEIFWLPA